MQDLTRRSLLASALGALAAPAALALEPVAESQAATRAPYQKTYVPYRKTYVLGKSVRGRKITVQRVGYPDRPVTVVLVGCIHGNEDDGIGIVKGLGRWTPPSNTCVYIVRTMNPDGNAVSDSNALHLKGRLNARGVNLNRNFPGGRRTGRRWQQTYSGPKNLSEPESRLMYNFLRKVKPEVLVVYHQHMHLVDYCGGKKALQRAYARRTKLKFTQLTRYKGSMATWYHQRYPKATVMTVELGVTTSAKQVARHQSALRGMIRAYAKRA
jgi:predicted deacylase